MCELESILRACEATGKMTHDMGNEYKHNHYVPEWYQRRFIPEEQEKNELYYLDLKPDAFVDGRGRIHKKKALWKQGPKFCFAQNDLYTMSFGSSDPKLIETKFFGDIDRLGRIAVEYFSNFEHYTVDHDAYQNMMIYLSTQKLRTPKGLEWIGKKAATTNKFTILRSMVDLRQLYCAIWTECIWQIADASASATKFIISDHPVTVYNRVCGPRSQYCRGSNDPDIWLNGTHTIFPLSLEKILILTNLSWVRNPYQSELLLRPNPTPFRSAIFKFNDIQTHRRLSEQEVIDINYIIKRRAFRFIAASKEEWLYPEKVVSTTKWSEYGHGYMLMPDPRSINLGGQIVIGHRDGTASHYDEYGRRPWHTDYAIEERKGLEALMLYRFKGEFARLFGPYRRGRSFQGMRLEEERDSDDLHQYFLSLESRKKPL